MSLKEKVQADMLNAMKAKEELLVSVLRMLKAEILKWETADERKEAQDNDVIALIKKSIKQRKDSFEQYKAGNRPELAAKEEKEIKILEKYLPAQMDEEAIKKIVQGVITEVSAKGKQDFGKVMGLAMKKTAGEADGGMVSKIVGEMLK